MQLAGQKHLLFFRIFLYNLNNRGCQNQKKQSWQAISHHHQDWAILEAKNLSFESYLNVYLSKSTAETKQ